MANYNFWLKGYLKMTNKFLIASIVSVVGVVPVAKASVLFEHNMAFTPSISSTYASASGNIQSFDQFVLAADSNISKIEAVLLFNNPNAVMSGPIEYSIWSADYSQKLYSASIQIAQLSSSPIGANSNVFDVSASFTGLSLNAGTYNLSIFDGNPSDSLAWAYEPLAFPFTGTSGYRDLTNNFGVQSGDRYMVFSIQGDLSSTSVPLPGTVWLFASGLSGVIGLNRRRTTNK